MNTLYDGGREGFLSAEVDWDGATIKAALVRGYTFDAAHRFVSQVLAAGGVFVAVVPLSGKSITDGIADANDLLFPAVPAGPTIPAILLYQASAVTGGADVAAGAQRLIGYIDTATGLPATPSGPDISVIWSNDPAVRIFKL